MERQRPLAASSQRYRRFRRPPAYAGRNFFVSVTIAPAWAWLSSLGPCELSVRSSSRCRQFTAPDLRQGLRLSPVSAAAFVVVLPRPTEQRETVAAQCSRRNHRPAVIELTSEPLRFRRASPSEDRNIFIMGHRTRRPRRQISRRRQFRPDKATHCELWSSSPAIGYTTPAVSRGPIRRLGDVSVRLPSSNGQRRRLQPG